MVDFNQRHHQLSYRPDIDGLRALAVLSVVFFHCFPGSLKGGFVGVDVFFVISGFLISSILLQKLNSNDFSFSNFYAKRIKRIFPALLAVMITCFVFGWVGLFPDEYKELGKHIAGGASFISNFILWGESGYFDVSAETKPLLHLWSLGIEEQFYLVWPVILWAAFKRQWNPVAVCLILLICSFVVNLCLINSSAVAVFYFPHTRVWELLCGALVAVYLLKEPEAMALPSVISNIGAACGLLLILVSCCLFNSSLHFPGGWASVPVLGACLLIASGPSAWVNRRILANRIAIWFGLISFPLYLWHWPLLTFTRIVLGGKPSVLIRFSCVMGSIILAWLTYHFLERRIRYGALKRWTVPLLVGVMGVMVCVGTLAYRNQGFVDRPSVKVSKNNTKELIRPLAVDDACRHYVHLHNPLFNYCRFENAGSTETVAVIGDSHAHVAFPGIAAQNAARGINTLLLANSSCPPYLDIEAGVDKYMRHACRARIHQLLSIVLARQDIRKVFIFSRGPIYLTGTDLSRPQERLFVSNLVSSERFIEAVQKTINLLVNAGKKVIFVSENPELYHPIQSCLSRPFRPTVVDCRPLREQVLGRFKEYYAGLASIKGAVVVDSAKVFCPNDHCLIFDRQGTLLYADDNHLSVTGSKFQANVLLKPYLS